MSHRFRHGAWRASKRGERTYPERKREGRESGSLDTDCVRLGHDVARAAEGNGDGPAGEDRRELREERFDETEKPCWGFPEWHVPGGGDDLSPGPGDDIRIGAQNRQRQCVFFTVYEQRRRGDGPHLRAPLV